MKIVTDESAALSKIKRRAYILSEKSLIVSKPDQARSFLVDMRQRLEQTRKTYKKLLAQVKELKHLTHEVENLFDNYYIIDGAISDVLNSPIDKGFKKLVQVEKSSTIYVPRIYSILKELLKTAEYRIDRELLYGFLQAYQSRTHLSIRELSFVPLFLRVILIENIEKVMWASIVSLDELKDAEYWFQQITKGGKDSDYSKLTSNLAHKYGVIPINLGFNLLQKLSQYGPDTRPIVKWLKLNLLKQGINIADLAEIENKRQNDISQEVGNIINSLRWINQIRWDNFIVEINMVDSFLLKDPAGIYSVLDQASQSAYRNEIVKISDQAGVYESEVAKLALRLCHQPGNDIEDKEQAENHVGYYLVGAGRKELEKKIGYERSLLERIQAFVLKKSTFVYLGSIFLISLILIFIFINLLPSLSISSVSFLGFLILALILNSDIAINLVNIFVSLLVPVRALFKLDLSSGPTEDQATFVVIPSMLRDQKSTTELLRRLEVNFLSNSQANIYFALLMDFKDSKTENTVYDQSLIEQITEGLTALNQKYSSPIKRFYLFHRRRIWNPQENVFMGWERKRGKLREFNLLLRGTRQTSYLENLPKGLPAIK